MAGEVFGVRGAEITIAEILKEQGSDSIAADPLPRLQVSDNKRSLVVALSSADVEKLNVGPDRRFLVKQDGSAFVWIGATMWKWKALSLDQMKHIIDDHSARGYTVLQIIAYPDRYKTVDQLVKHAEDRNMYLALVTGWYRDVQRDSVAMN